MTGEASERRDIVAFWLIAGFMLVLYAVPGEWLPGFAAFRLALVTSGLAATLMLLRRITRFEPLQVDGVRGIALGLFTLLALVSISWSVHPEASKATAIELFKLTAIYLTVVNVVTTPRRLRILMAVLVVASIVTSIGVIKWYFRGTDLSEGFRARWVGAYADPNHMAMDVGLIVPLGVAFVARKKEQFWLRCIGVVAVGLAVAAIVFSHSRGGFIGLIVAMTVWAFREKRRLQAVFVGAAMVVGLLVFAPKSFWERTETVGSFRSDASAMGRVHAWEVAATMSSDKPLLGVGVGAFRYAWPLYAPPEARRAYVAHNVFLDVIGELGFVGLLLFLVFAGGSVSGAFRASHHPEHGWMGRAFVAACAGYLVCDLFSGHLLSAHFYVLFGLAAACDRIAQLPVTALAQAPQTPLRGVWKGASS